MGHISAPRRRTMIVVKGPTGYYAIRDPQPHEEKAQRTCQSLGFQFKVVEGITNAQDLPAEVDLALRTLVDYLMNS